MTGTEIALFIQRYASTLGAPGRDGHGGDDGASGGSRLLEPTRSSADCTTRSTSALRRTVSTARSVRHQPEEAQVRSSAPLALDRTSGEMGAVVWPPASSGPTCHGSTCRFFIAPDASVRDGGLSTSLACAASAGRPATAPIELHPRRCRPRGKPWTHLAAPV